MKKTVDEFYEKQRPPVYKLAIPLVFFAYFLWKFVIFPSQGIVVLRKISSKFWNIPEWLAVFLLVAIPLIITVFAISATLSTVINQDGIYVKYFPFHLKYKFFDWQNIDNVYVRKYRPILEYGGWGLRYGYFKINFAEKFSIKYAESTAYTIKGKMGLQIELKNGRKILVGTQKPEEIEEILLKLKAKKPEKND